MYNILNPNRFDKSPFQYARMTYLAGRIDENFRKYADGRQQAPGRLDSSHLLMKILSSLSVPFNGDLQEYMVKVDVAMRGVNSSLGITSSANNGGLHTEGVFYQGCPEIIIYARSDRYTVMDLWRNWREVTPIEVLCHPVTDTTVFELGVKNAAELKGRDLAIISIDVPLLAGQWKMWQAANPDKLMEQFLTTTPLVGMMKSHLNLTLFNRLMVKLNIREPVTVKTNLPFAQTPTDKHTDDLVDEIIAKVGGKAMAGSMILDSIPVFYGSSYLHAVALPSLTPTFQVMWVLISQKVEACAVMLEFGHMTGFDKLVHELTVIRRTLIEIRSGQLLSNGLSTSDSIFLTERLDRLVVQRLPQ